MSLERPQEPDEPRAARESELRRRAEAAAALEHHIADRFARLHATSTALSASVSPADVAAVMAARGMALVDAIGCAVAFLAEDGARLELVAVRGVGASPLARPLAVALEAEPTLAIAIRAGRPAFLGGEGDPAGGPAAAGLAGACGLRAEGVRAAAALPLFAGRRALGLVAVAFAAPRPFDEEEQAFLEAYAHQCALALERSRLYEAERAARLEAQRAVAEARRAVDMQERLVGVVGHDLRTPLSAIRMATALLVRRGGLTDEQARTLSRLGASAARMTGIIRDLLDFSRVRREGTIPLERVELDLADLVRRAIAELRAVHPERDVVLEVPAEAPGVGDPERLTQVVSNLVGNAIQHSPAGSRIRVKVEAIPEALLFRVHNVGPPIPAALLPDIFEPFRRGAAAPGATGSVGLGLFIVRELVRAHGGTVEVTSSGAAGTTFTVRLPAAARPAASAPAPEPFPTGPSAPDR